MCGPFYFCQMPKKKGIVKREININRMDLGPFANEGLYNVKVSPKFRKTGWHHGRNCHPVDPDLISESSLI